MDDLLNKRAAPPQPPSNLAERIIEQSRQQPVRQKASLLDWLETLFDSLLIPRPAYAILAVLFIGVLFGAYLEGTADSLQDDQLSFVYTEDNFNTGEWL